MAIESTHAEVTPNFFRLFKEDSVLRCEVVNIALILIGIVGFAIALASTRWEVVFPCRAAEIFYIIGAGSTSFLLINRISMIGVRVGWWKDPQQVIVCKDISLSRLCC